MELTFCILLPLAFLATVTLGPLLVLGYRLISQCEERRRRFLQGTYKVSMLCVALTVGYLAFANIHVVSCDKKDSISRALEGRQPTQVAGLPCTCGCGRHK